MIIERIIYLSIILWYTLSYTSEIRYALDSMFAYQIWDLATKIIAAIVAFGGAYTAYKKYKEEKHKEIYLKRLNEIYAPLYGLIVRQETLRELYFPHIKREDAPILTRKIQKQKGYLTITEHGPEIKMEPDGPEEIDPLIDPEVFLIEFIKCENKGLSRPELLILMYKYQLLTKESAGSDSRAKDAQKEKTKIERKLVNEIIDGYTESLILLGLGKKEVITKIKQFLIDIPNE